MNERRLEDPRAPHGDSQSDTERVQDPESLWPHVLTSPASEGHGLNPPTGQPSPFYDKSVTQNGKENVLVYTEYLTTLPKERETTQSYASKTTSF